MMNHMEAKVSSDPLMHIDGQLKIRFVPNGEEDWIEFARMDQSKDVLFRPAQQKDIEKYPQLWSVYSSHRPKSIVDGTALTELPGLTSEIAMQFRLKGLFTVEQLEGLDDYAAAGLGASGRMYRDIAKLFLISKGGGKAPAKSDIKQQVKAA
jgi:hypothetical protein